ncbi:tRNA pseudouridine(55) synthase TruB [Nesterenkonia alba]|uniref:tRNA pseudouridine(55) synthase TruB n=1 Tax=Nesterenkonia alba TaxID=515814 RepID=UPI0003B30AE5|nr:tRNA pseudouridine(55) synthase TruB [Nesterenkonia alba]
MGKKQRPEELQVGSGLVLVDKPAGWTSHDVVGRIRKLAGTRKVGHAGTLDPMATGVLVVGLNKATRLLTHIVGVDKTYTATIRLGESTTTDDAEGEVLSRQPAHQLATELAPGPAGEVLPAEDGAITAAITRLTGEIMQVPSTVSAIKVAGRRAYERARQGEEVELQARGVVVHRFAVHRARPVDGGALIDLDVEVRVSSGTYVRALARDLGELLGTGGHLTALRRTAVGPYREDQCLSLAALAEDFGYIGLAEAAGQLFPARQLTAEEAGHLRHGRRITASAGVELLHPQGERAAELSPQREGLTAAFGPDGELVALLRDIPAIPGASSSPDAAQAAVAGPEMLQAKPELVFAPAD